MLRGLVDEVMFHEKGYVVLRSRREGDAGVPARFVGPCEALLFDAEGEPLGEGKEYRDMPSALRYSAARLTRSRGRANHKEWVTVDVVPAPLGPAVVACHASGGDAGSWELVTRVWQAGCLEPIEEMRRFGTDRDARTAYTLAGAALRRFEGVRKAERAIVMLVRDADYKVVERVDVMRETTRPLALAGRDLRLVG